jgi:dimethylamine/trimethylamine dehydrogenase
VTLVTPAARVSEWTVNTMEQERIQRRLIELGVEVLVSQTLVGAAPGVARIACVYTERERELPADGLVLVTARDPRDGQAAELLEASERWAEAGVASVRAVGDAWAPATIAAAVWDGRRYAEQLDETDVPLRREVIRLAEEPA